jgi:hypothetical protein
MTTWNHRLIEHRHSTDKFHELYYSVHEIHYDDENKPQAFTNNAISPRTKVEAEQIVRAFDKPAIAWVDDATFFKDPMGFDDYGVFGWLEEKLEKGNL